MDDYEFHLRFTKYLESSTDQSTQTLQIEIAMILWSLSPYYWISGSFLHIVHPNNSSAGLTPIVEWDSDLHISKYVCFSFFQFLFFDLCNSKLFQYWPVLTLYFSNGLRPKWSDTMMCYSIYTTIFLEMSINKLWSIVNSNGVRKSMCAEIFL